MKNHVGIIGMGIYLPSHVVTANEIAQWTKGALDEATIIEKLGVVEKRIPQHFEGTQEMAVLAALNCIHDAQIDPLEIDVILCFGEEWKEYPLTTSALHIQHRINALNAWGIDVQNRCATALAAIKIAKDMLTADAEIETILIVGGYRNGDLVDYTDIESSMLFNLGAGAGALLLRKNVSKNRILGTHIIADGSLALSAGVEIGGQRHPITKENIDKAYKSLKIMEPIKMKERLNAVSHQNWVHCIHEACRKSDVSVSEIDYLSMLHVKRSAHKELLRALGLREDQSIYLEKYGHTGQVDQILSLYLALRAGKVKENSIICMLAAGIGYVWAATIIAWGESDV